MLPDQRPLENIDSDQGSSKHGNSITIFLEKKHYQRLNNYSALIWTSAYLHLQPREPLILETEIQITLWIMLLTHIFSDDKASQIKNFLDSGKRILLLEPWRDNIT